MSDFDLLFRYIGLYTVHWSSLELAVDIATMKITNGTVASVIKCTGGKDVHKKMIILKNLVEKNNINNRDKIIALISNIPKASRRNSISHSYMNFGTLNSEKFVEFVHVDRKKQVKIIRFNED